MDDTAAGGVDARGPGVTRPSVAPGDAEAVIEAGARPESVVASFAAVVRVQPDRVAVNDGVHRLTFAELDARANAVAQAILATEPAAGIPVAVITSHDAGAVVAMLGVAKAGLSYVVLDPRAPEDFLAKVIERTAARLIVADAAHAPVAAKLGDLAVIDLGSTTPAADPGVRVDPAAPLMVSFTSGTSGEPKAVMHSHRNVVGNARRVGEAVSVGPADALLGAAPFAYVASSTATYTALLAGATLCPYDFPARGTAGFSSFASDVGLTVAQLPPAVLLDLGRRVAAGDPPTSTVRLVMTGGDRVQAVHLRAAAATFPEADVLMRYSTSETNWVAGMIVDPRSYVLDGDLPIGWPVPWMTVRVVDEDGQPVPVGVPGELVVAGDNLALGYLGDAERTAQRFRTGAHGREYWTGDRVSVDEAGVFRFLGRVDSVVKIRSMLVDLALVESALRACPGVESAAAIVVPGTDALGDRLVAFVTGTHEKPRRLRRRIADALPPAMVPAVIEPLFELPLTPRGKVDRAALAGRATSALTSNYVAPVGDVETALARLFADVLGVGEVGRDHDFFAMGGDSLASAELLTTIAATLGVDLQHSDLLTHPTPRLLAQRISGGRVATRRDAPLLIPVSVGDPDATPVVLFSGGGGGHLQGISRVGRAMPQRSAFVVVPRAFEYRGLPDRSIRAMAATAAASIMDRLGSGRVILVGHSSGGNVAMETARRLVSAGVDVELTVLLDTRACSPTVRHRRRVTRRIRQAAAKARWAREDAGLAYSPLDVVRWHGSGARAVLGQWIRSLKAGVLVQRPRDQRHAFMALVRQALNHHLETPYAGHVVLIRAADRKPLRVGQVPPDLWWGESCTGVLAVHTVRGGHTQLSGPPFVHDVVAVIESELERVSGKRGDIAVDRSP